MGFEQLAALKEQLARKAKAESGNAPSQKTKAGQQTGKPALKPAAKPSKPGSPGQAQARKPSERPASGRAPSERKAPVQQREPARQVDPVVLSISRLQKHFPKAFPKNPAPKLPLKLGTFEDLVQHAPRLGLTEEQLREAIRTWCSGSRYWTSMVEGAARVDLNGEPSGAVTQADANRARQLKSRRGGKPRPRNKAQAASAAVQEAPAAGGEAPAAADAPSTQNTQATPVAQATSPDMALQAAEPSAPDAGQPSADSGAVVNTQDGEPAAAPAQRQGE